MKSKLTTWLGIAVSIAALVFIGVTFNLGEALEAIRLADGRWLVLAVFVYIFQFPLRGLRWSILLRSVKNVSPRTATEVFTIGFMANNLLPLRLGDVARALVL